MTKNEKMSVSVRIGQCQSVLKKLTLVFAMFAICVTRSFAQSADEIKTIAIKEAEYALSAMERLKGKAIHLPEVVACLGILKYAETIGNGELIDRVSSLYKEAYLKENTPNRLSTGHIEWQTTTILPLELYRLTSDKSFLNECLNITETQMRNSQENGIYKNATFVSEEMFMITMLQTKAFQVYGNEKRLDFVADNLDVYMEKQIQQQKDFPFFKNWKDWDSDGKWIGNSYYDLVFLLPFKSSHTEKKCELREKFNPSYFSYYKDTDPEKCFSDLSLAELLKFLPKTHKSYSTILNYYKDLMNARCERLLSGELRNTPAGKKGMTSGENMFPFIELCAMATGVRYNFLQDEKYKKCVQAKWNDFKKNYNPPILKNWNVISKPLFISGGRLLFASSMLNIDKPVIKKDVLIESAPQVVKTYLKDEIVTTLDLFGQLRFAEVTDDLNLVNKIVSDFKFNKNNAIHSVIESELYRISSKIENECDIIENVNELIINPLDDKVLTALIQTQAFKVYGHNKFANSAIKNVLSEKYENILTLFVVTELLQRLPKQNTQYSKLLEKFLLLSSKAIEQIENNKDELNLSKYSLAIGLKNDWIRNNELEIKLFSQLNNERNIANSAIMQLKNLRESEIFANVAKLNLSNKNILGETIAIRDVNTLQKRVSTLTKEEALQLQNAIALLRSINKSTLLTISLNDIKQQQKTFGFSVTAKLALECYAQNKDVGFKVLAQESLLELSKTKCLSANDIYEFGTSFALAAKILNDKKYVTEQANTLKEISLKLQDSSGYFHQTESIKNPWSRSSGLAIAGIVDFLKELPKDNKNNFAFRRIFKNFAYALERDQDYAGLWHIVPDDFNSAQDSFGSAFFLSALATGLKESWIYRLEFREMVNLGWNGITDNVNEYGLLKNCVVSSKPKNIVSSYALLPRVTGSLMGQVALLNSTLAINEYKHSFIPNSEEDIDAVLGGMNEMKVHQYLGKLPDGRALQHISIPVRFEIWPSVYYRYRKKGDPIKNRLNYKKTGQETYCSPSTNPPQKPIPNSLKNQRYPVGGISVWVKDNPSIHTVTDELGYCFLSMPFVAFEKAGKPSNIEVMAQAPGHKPAKIMISKTWWHLNYITKLVTAQDSTTSENLPKGVSDKIDGKLLAPFLLKYHREERKELLAMLGKASKIIQLDDGKIQTPLYISGKIISATDGKPVKESSIWLKRNPFMLARANDDGEFEMMKREIVLYEQTTDSVMLTAPGYKPLELPLNSYLKKDFIIQMQPDIYKPQIQNHTTVPFVKIPKGFFRMGLGHSMYTPCSIDPSGKDFNERNCWPIQTVTMPSFYFSQYNLVKQLRQDVFKWAIKNGYTSEVPEGMAFTILANALSEKDGFTPCYYTADLKVIRNVKDLSEDFVCNWRADGYRLPTWAEWVYANRAGRTTNQYWGVSGDKYRDHVLSGGARFSEKGTPVPKVMPARRLPLTWGVYDSYLGQGFFEQAYDYRFWRNDNSYHPRGPVLREAKYLERFYIFPTLEPSKLRTGRFIFALQDNLETCWLENWSSNPIGFQFTGYGFHLVNSTFFVTKSDPMTSYGATRFARSAENICNDISLIKKINDPTLSLPKPIALSLINESISMSDIPAGTQQVGSADKGAYPSKAMYKDLTFCSAAPEHKVLLSSFKMGKFEITVQQWRNVQQWGKQNGYTDLPYGEFGESSSKDIRHPVVGVNWYDVIKWCNAASEKENFSPCYFDNKNVYRTGVREQPIVYWNNNGYRLPTEAEWEYAALTGRKDAAFYWGDHCGYQYAWQYSREGYSNSNKKSHPVGQKIGNKFGLYDTFGNVWEWCWDWAGPYDIIKDDINDPKGSSRDAIVEYGKKWNEWMENKTHFIERTNAGKDYNRYIGRIIRGSSYNLGMVQFSFREGNVRANRKPERSKDSIGFRVVRGK